MKKEGKVLKDKKKTKKGDGGKKLCRKSGRRMKSDVEVDRVINSDEDDDILDEDTESHPAEHSPSPVAESTKTEFSVDMEKNILEMEAPTFTTLSRVGSAALRECSWDVKAEIIGDKVLSPMIHCCEICDKPILIYGRMIPCKHVFCVTCAAKDKKKCQHCKADADRVDNVRLGSIFMCTEGGHRYGKDGCRRTYMSPRDLQAHVLHRHSDRNASARAASNSNKRALSQVPPVPQKPSLPTDESQGSVLQNPQVIPPRPAHSQGVQVHPQHSSIQSHSHNSMPFRSQLSAPGASSDGGSSGFGVAGKKIMSPVGAEAQQNRMGVAGNVQHLGPMQHQAHHVQGAVQTPPKFLVRPPRTSPMSNLHRPPPSVPQPQLTPESVISTSFETLMSTAPPPISSSSAIPPPQSSPIPVLASIRTSVPPPGTPVLPKHDVVSSTDQGFRPQGLPPRAPPMISTINMQFASNFYASTPPPMPVNPPSHPPPGMHSDAPLPAGTGPPFMPPDLNIPPPNFVSVPPPTAWNQNISGYYR